MTTNPALTAKIFANVPNLFATGKIKPLTDTLKVVLCNTANTTWPTTLTSYTDIVPYEFTTAGYTAGGVPITVSLANLNLAIPTLSSTLTLDWPSLNYLAPDTLRSFLLYDDSTPNKDLIVYCNVTAVTGYTGINIPPTTWLKTS